MILIKDNIVWDFFNFVWFSFVNKIIVMIKCFIKIVIKDYFFFVVI